ncbi:glutamate--tRNA ligase [Striga asiatica]|uniref:Glutamate--tRNA ligase n=1 Tax=Striga asiatica TaxID=4170 RepID=A0A5A7R544_STRAF|nr:glutamate--tRNA ligase [Striga asiatica]
MGGSDRWVSGLDFPGSALVEVSVAGARFLPAIAVAYRVRRKNGELEHALSANLSLVLLLLLQYGLTDSFGGPSCRSTTVNVQQLQARHIRQPNWYLPKLHTVLQLEPPEPREVMSRAFHTTRSVRPINSTSRRRNPPSAASQYFPLKARFISFSTSRLHRADTVSVEWLRGDKLHNVGVDAEPTIFLQITNKRVEAPLARLFNLLEEIFSLIPGLSLAELTEHVVDEARLDLAIGVPLFDPN